MKRTSAEWLRSAVTQETDQCIDWPFGRATQGYGRLYDPETGQPEGAHRAALRYAGRPSPAPGLLAMHSCDNRLCVNPRHLRWGTHAQNTKDMVDRQRFARPSAVLTPDQVRGIRALRGVMQQKDIAALFGISQGTVSEIQLRRKWKDIA